MKILSDFFYPQPCEQERTLNYFKSIKTNILQKKVSEIINK